MSKKVLTPQERLLKRVRIFVVLLVILAIVVFCTVVLSIYGIL